MCKIKLLWFTILIVITVWSGVFIERFKPGGPEVLTENWQVFNSDTGIARLEQGQFYLSSSTANKAIEFIQVIRFTKNPDYLKLKGSLKCLDVIPGQQKWNKARLLLIQYDASGERIQMPHEVISISGSRDWEDYKASFVVSPFASELNIILKLSACTGSMWAKNLSLIPVVKTQFYLWLKRVLFSAWFLFFIFLFYPHTPLKEQYLYPQIILCCCVIGILFVTTMTGEVKTRITKKIDAQVQVSKNIYKKIIPGDISGIGHFCSFLLLGTSLCFVMPIESKSHILTNIALLAGGAELMQFHVDERTPQFMDFFIDVSGGISGIMVFTLLFLKKNINISHL